VGETELLVTGLDGKSRKENSKTEEEENLWMKRFIFHERTKYRRCKCMARAPNRGDVQNILNNNKKKKDPLIGYLDNS